VYFCVSFTFSCFQLVFYCGLSVINGNDGDDDDDDDDRYVG